MRLGFPGGAVMSAPVYSFERIIDVGILGEHHLPAVRAINKVHGVCPETVHGITDTVKNAHYRLVAVQQQRVTVDVYADGSMRIRGAS